MSEVSKERRARRRRKFVAFEVGALVLLLLVTEVSLRSWAPFVVASVGSLASPNALAYGWGFAPGTKIYTRNPDTGEYFESTANGQGWRDSERVFEKPSGRFRIVVIGDSNTVGLLVPEEAVYTRVLERRLRGEGYDVEVVNISMGGWATDQALEALRLEGLRYDPDLVVVQFCTNDLTGNLLRTAPPLPALKPFFYRLDAHGRAERRPNPDYTPPLESPRSWFTERVVKRSELLKRLVFSHLREREYSVGSALPPISYRHDEQSAAILRLELGADADKLLAALPQGPIDPALLEGLLSGLSAEEAEVGRRILEDRIFRKRVNVDSYAVPSTDVGSPAWRLLLALLRSAIEITRAQGADFALVTDNEQGAYEWSRFWCHLAPGNEPKLRFLQPSRALRDFCKQEGVEFVEPEVPHERARNDPHPSVAGNAAMAENLYRHLLERHAPALEASRR